MRLYIDPNVTLDDLDDVARRLDMQLFDSRDDGLRSRGRWAGKQALKVGLRPLGDTYRKQNPISGRRVWAVDWFGHRDFMRAVFALDADATFDTAVDRWAGSDDFELRHRDSAYRQEGSMFCPYSACEASLNGGMV